MTSALREILILHAFLYNCLLSEYFNYHALTMENTYHSNENPSSSYGGQFTNFLLKVTTTHSLFLLDVM